MPSIPSSPPSAPSLSSSALVGLVVCAVAIVCVFAVFFVTRHILKLRERRTRTSDLEKSAGVTIPSSESYGVIDISKKSIAAAALAAARSNLPFTLKASVRAKVPPVCVAMVLAKVAPRCHLKQLEEYEVPACFAATRHHTLPGPSPLRTVVCAQDVKRTAAAAALAAARTNLPATLKVRIPHKMPAVNIAKVLGRVAPRSHLKQLNEYEVPARFGTRRTHPRRGQSPLRAVICASDVFAPAPAPASASPFSVLCTSRLGNIPLSSHVKQQPAPKAFRSSPTSRPARRMFTGAKENGLAFQFPLRARVT